MSTKPFPDEREALLEQLRQFVAEIDPRRVEVRREAEAEARKLIESKLGALRPEDLRRLFELVNRDWSRGKPKRNRFSPGFVGRFVTDAIASLEAFNRWVARIWGASTEEVPAVLDAFWEAKEIRGAGRGLPTALLYLREPQRYSVLVTSIERGAARLAGRSFSGRSGANYEAFNRAVEGLRGEIDFPVEVTDLVLWYASRVEIDGGAMDSGTNRAFQGFQPETFAFLQELRENNTSEWMEANLARYAPHVKGPLRSLVADIGEEFLAAYAPQLEREPKFPNTLSKLRKNVYGKVDEGAYWSHLWAAFHRPDRSKTEDFQLILSVKPDRVIVAFYTFSAGADDIDRFRRTLRAEADLAQRLLRNARDAGLRSLQMEHPSPYSEKDIPDLEGVLESLEEGPLAIGRGFDAGDDTLMGERFVDAAIDTLAAALPFFLLATEEDPASAIARFEAEWGEASAEEPEEVSADPETSLQDLVDETSMPEQRIVDLLDLVRSKPQLVPYGAPGTGKTWLAERLGAFIAGSEDRVRTIQFHPSYSYEDFIEGIRPRTEQGQLRYEPADGVFKRFCNLARKHPRKRFVIVVDEINRGNIPRIFGELLYLLERRGRSVELPVSGEAFSVPTNVVLLGTMNTADQSIALLDMALRRRFHFERLDPDPTLLGNWLEQAEARVQGVERLLERLNERLDQFGIEPDRWIGHSHFMVRGIDEARLRSIWEHSVVPTLEELFHGDRERLEEFDFDEFVTANEGQAGLGG